MKKAFVRIFKTGWTNFRRNSYMSFGTTGVMTLVLLLFSGLVAVNFISTQIVASLQDKVDVTVYFKTDASQDEIMQVKSDLEKRADVKTVGYVSREQALTEFKTLHAGQAVIQESLTELNFNPLQASLNIKAQDSTQYPAITEFLEGNKFRTLVDKINFYENEAVINRVQGITGGIQNWGLLATLALALIAVLVTFNTIRLTIYNQKQEIEIMKLVGGSNWHIKAPYLIEGAIYGGFAALITAIVFYPAVYFISPKVVSLIPGVSLFDYFSTHVLSFLSVLLFAGILIGTTSSFVAIRRFLKV